jgi:hypothetical protein
MPAMSVLIVLIVLTARVHAEKAGSTSRLAEFGQIDRAIRFSTSAQAWCGNMVIVRRPHMRKFVPKLIWGQEQPGPTSRAGCSPPVRPCRESKGLERHPSDGRSASRTSRCRARSDARTVLNRAQSAKTISILPTPKGGLECRRNADAGQVASGALERPVHAFRIEASAADACLVRQIDDVQHLLRCPPERNSVRV